MRPRRSPPATTEELLLLLRRTRLLDEAALRRLGDAWPGGDDPGPHVEDLVRAGLVTRYQGDQLLAGRAGALRLGPYRLLDQLGRGGMGQVFKAEHMLLRRLVALKVLGKARRAGSVGDRRGNPETPGADTPASQATPRRDAGRLTQVRRESETVGQLSHPNIVAAHDARRLRGRMVLVLEHVDGVDLERLVSETGPLPVALAVEVTRQAAVALGYLHEQRLVHRDVKPANLILTHPAAVGGAPAVKLLDLGLACPAAQAGGELCGTPDYLAPERGLSPDATDIRSDLYSLGCTLYHLLTGRVPFPGGGGWTGKLLRHRIEVPDPVQATRPDVPPPVAALVERLMARDPRDRFATPDEVLATIEAFPSALAPAPEIAPANGPPPRGRRALVVALCLVAVVLGGGAGNMARKGLTTSSDPASPERNGGVSPPVPGPPAQARRPEGPAAPATSPLPNLIESARDGDVIVVPAGRHVVGPIQVRGKRLTLRGGAGERPILARATHTAWDALIQSDRDLTLEHLELHGGDAIGPPAPLVALESASLVVRDCSLTQRCAAPAVSVRGGALLCLERTSVTALEQGVAVEARSQADGRVVVRDSEMSVRGAAGPAILLWGTDAHPSRPLDVELTGSKLRAGRVVACRSLAGAVTLRATDNHLLFHQALVSLDGHRGDWRDRLSWLGRQNRFETTGPWLRLDGRPGPAWDETAFAQRWSGRP
ncbi:MAG: serine/threonine-protein kinase [Gemmataceae bacterium]